jgi:hypothetical protein
MLGLRLLKGAALWAPRARGRLALFMDAKLDVAKL